ncbi:DUF4386 family protein [Sphingorhabdus pulchriflava]|uniref:DUF4386 family protein n=1 Tax=Sphingorhabdus pulchriflava TaxID=2292257 RepID=A0A371BHU2_9SPHN|nr:DUF4386 family protein [Sphingorhabdus pulchriflava]RDV07172.1 DUF4386 family protein [Sphingorhabdus pulchriflava]
MKLQSAGRWFGAAILLGYVLDIASNFWLQPGIRSGDGAMGIFLGAGKRPDLVGMIVLLSMISGIVSLMAAALLCKVSVGRSIFWLSLGYLGLKAGQFGLGGVEMATLQLYRSLGSTMIAESGGELVKLAEPIRHVIAGLRDGLHLPTMLTGGISVLLLYYMLQKSALIPRWLGGIGMLAALSQMTGVSTGLFGSEVNFAFLAPLALVHLTLALWLLVRGFGEPANI